MCKRCAYFCPLGLDVAEATRQIRDVLTAAGKPVPYVAKVVDNFLRHGNNVGMPPKVVAMAAKALAKKNRKGEGTGTAALPLRRQALPGAAKRS